MSEPVALSRIEAVHIESDPFSSRVGVMVNTCVLDDLYAALPAPFLDALYDLYEHRDDRTCWRCNAMTGYVVAEQPSGFDGLEWRPTGLAREGDGPVAVLCEECSPYVPSSDARTAMDEVAS